MKITSRVALAGHAWAGNGEQPQVAARVRLRDEAFSPRAPAPVWRDAVRSGGVGPAIDPAHHYDISRITDEFDLPHWTGEWRRLLATSDSPEKIYQTPEFFRFLTDSHTSNADPFELFAIREQGKVVGMVPVRVSCVALDTRLGGLSLLSLKQRIVRILGSVPLMPADPALLDQLFAYLLLAFPECAAVSMQAFPMEMKERLGRDPRHVALIVHGWRACHTVPLPATLQDYMGKLNAKKRYNLTRQHRLLEQATGTLELKRIDRSSDVKDLVDGIIALSGEASMVGNCSARDYRVLAANRLLLSYVIKSGDDFIAVIAGSRYGDTWHIHQIHYAEQFRHLSAGAVALNSALQNVITEFAFTTADFGFGEPRHRFASTHELKHRAHVLVTRKGSAARWVFGAFVRYDNWHAACVRRFRPYLTRLFGR